MRRTDDACCVKELAMKDSEVRRAWRAFCGLVFLGVLVTMPLAMADQHPKPPRSLRLYVFDCGGYKGTFNPEPVFGLKKEQLANVAMSVPCFLIVDPKGTLVWDTGVIPDSDIPPGGGLVTQGIATADKRFLPQLAAIGYTPADINYLALSHYHWDHSANASAFTSSTWLVRKVEYDAIFSGQKLSSFRASDFNGLKDSKHIFIDTDDYDVFGDGKVIIKFAPGHTPGHQVLFLRLAKTGPIVLSGDLYHYPEERQLGVIPPNEPDKEQIRASRANIEAFLKQTGAQLWIEHDLAANAQLKKAPAFYE